MPCRWCNFFLDFDSTPQACSAVKQGRRVPVGTSGWCSGQMLLLPCRLWIWIFWMVSRTWHEQLWICSVMFRFVRQSEVKLWSKVAWRQEIQGIDGIVHPEWAPDTSRYAKGFLLPRLPEPAQKHQMLLPQDYLSWPGAVRKVHRHAWAGAVRVWWMSALLPPGAWTVNNSFQQPIRIKKAPAESEGAFIIFIQIVQNCDVEQSKN